MASCKKPSKLSRDINARAAAIVALSTGQMLPKLIEAPDIPKPISPPAREKNPAAVALGRLGGLKAEKRGQQALQPKNARKSPEKPPMPDGKSYKMGFLKFSLAMSIFSATIEEEKMDMQI